MQELVCEHIWISTNEGESDCDRQRCRRCGDVRFVRYVNGDIILVNGITRAVLAWEDDGGCP
jgi:hypothetical protein